MIFKPTCSEGEILDYIFEKNTYDEAIRKLFVLGVGTREDEKGVIWLYLGEQIKLGYLMPQ